MKRRLLRFLRRHAWSVSLSGLSALSFARLASEVQAGELGPFDEAVARSITGWRGRLDGPMVALTQMGGFEGMTILCVVCALALFGIRKGREAAFLVVCGLGALFFSAALKLAFHRPRPDSAAHYLLEVPGSFSFPSGHAMGSTTIVGSLLVVAYALLPGWPWRTVVTFISLSFVIGVAGSRVYFGLHFPSDVVGGVLAAAAWVAAVTGWFYPRLLPGEVSGKR